MDPNTDSGSTTEYGKRNGMLFHPRSRLPATDSFKRVAPINSASNYCDNIHVARAFLINVPPKPAMHL
jgi:hypothetical protein